MFQLEPQNAISVTRAAVCLHNLQRIRYPQMQNAELEANVGPDGAWRGEGVLEDVEREGRGPRASKKAKQTRAYLRHYYNSPAGSVRWQNTAINLPLNN